jgi:hypothetical protein
MVIEPKKKVIFKELLLYKEILKYYFHLKFSILKELVFFSLDYSTIPFSSPNPKNNIL